MRTLLLALWLLLSASSASAFYGTATPPAGWHGATGAWLFGGPGRPGAIWVGGHAGAVTGFAGREIPARLALGSGAPRAIARAALFTPLGRAASFIAWAVAAGWAWNEVEQRWEVGEDGYTGFEWNINGHLSGTCEGAAAAFRDASYPWAGTVGCTVTTEGANLRGFWFINATSGGCCVTSGIAYGVPTGLPPTTRPATEEDADELATQPMPDAVPNEAQEYIPLPQALPEVEPSRIPTGSPVAQGTDPETYRQPVTDVRGAPTEAEPWRVDATPREVTGTRPTGVTDVEHLDGSEDPSTEETPGLCDLYPDIVACQRLGDPPADDVPTRVQSVDYSAVSISGASGCPAAIPMGQHELSFTALCSNLESVRPLVIALGFLAAAVIIAAALRA